MKRTLSSLLLLIASIIAASSTNVYVIPIDDEINSTTWRQVRQGCNAATDADADILLIHLNTYGGAVVYADSIRTALLNYPRPTIAFIDNNAASAGALISIACDSIYMRRGASIGAATVVDGEGRQMPDKYQSYMRSMMRATAEANGRDPLIAEAMVDHRVIVPGLIDSTRVLTFTADEARKWDFSDGEAENIDEILRNKLHLADYNISTYQATFWDYLIGFLTNPAFQAVLIMIIVGGIYFELHAPGIGFPSAAALIATVLYFLPLYIEGIAEPWVILMFVVGLILLILELIVIPGFGVAGIAGACLMIVSLFAALLDGFNFTFDHYYGGEVIDALLVVSIGLLLSITVIAFCIWKLGYDFIPNKIGLAKQQNVDEGYIGVSMQPAQLIGRYGRSVTVLRPAGKVEIDGTVYDAVSLRDFIDADSEVEVVRYENAQIYVTLHK